MYIVQHYNYYIFHIPAYINEDPNGTPYFVYIKLIKIYNYCIKKNHLVSVYSHLNTQFVIIILTSIIY